MRKSNAFSQKRQFSINLGLPIMHHQETALIDRN